MNLIALLEFELVYSYVKIQHVSHYAIETSPLFYKCNGGGASASDRVTARISWGLQVGTHFLQVHDIGFCIECKAICEDEWRYYVIIHRCPSKAV